MPRGNARTAPGPVITTGYADGVFWYVVTWPDATAARFHFRWQATAAANGWTPPAYAAQMVPNKAFRYV